MHSYFTLPRLRTGVTAGDGGDDVCLPGGKLDRADLGQGRLNSGLAWKGSLRCLRAKAREMA